MNEKILTTAFHNFIKKHPRHCSETYEFKCIKTGSFRYSLVKPWQVNGLLTSLKGLWHKIPDTFAVNGHSSQKPFDGLYIIAKAYVVPIFYKERRYKLAFLIPISDFVEMMASGTSVKMTDLEKLGFEKFYL